MKSVGLNVDAFVAGVGTGGTVMGIDRYLRAKQPKVKVYALEPAESPTLSTGYKVGSHRIQGISDEFIPHIVCKNELNGILQISDGDSILVAQLLAKQLGLAVGISSGANVIGAIRLHEQLGKQSIVATLWSDSNKKYLSTDLMKNEPMCEEYLAANLQFISYKPIARLPDNKLEHLRIHDY